MIGSRKPTAWIFASLAATLLALSSPAVEVRTWSPDTPEELSKGTFHGTAADLERGIVLAPEVEDWWGPEVGTVWAVQPYGKDGSSAFVALSEPARILSVASKGGELWFRGAQDEIVTSLFHLGAREGVIFGVAPSGKLMRAPGPEHSEMIRETGAEYVWDIARDGKRTLWIATGSPGRILASAPGSHEEYSVAWETGDDPVRSLAPLPDGGVVAGTGKQGRILRIGPSGDRTVLFDADEEEIADLVIGADGTIWALATERARKLPAKKSAATTERTNGERTSAEPAAPGGTPSVQVRVTTSTTPPTAKRPAAGAAPAGGALYRIDRSGDVEKVWKSRDGIPFALALDGAGNLLVGTAKDGKILKVVPHRGASVHLSIGSEKVTALASTPADRLFIGGSADARFSVAGPGAGREGAWLGEPVDAGWIADWGAMEWYASVPEGTGVGVRARSGNSSEPDETWSPWKPVDASGTGVPRGRYFQARLDLVATADGLSPNVERLRLSYRTLNRAPVIERLGVDEPGIAWHRGPTQPSSRHGLQVADDPVARSTSKRLKTGARNGGPIRKSYEPGVRTFHWSSTDPDGDRVRYSLEIRKEGEAEWFPLAGEITDAFFSWDGRGMPDGKYQVRLSVDDSPDNSAGEEHSARRTGDFFTLDGTPPEWVHVDLDDDRSRYRLEIGVLDRSGTIAALEYALDGGDWVSIDPVDGVADSGEETYRLVLPRDGKTGRSRHLVLRVSDRSGNLSGKRIVLPR